MTQGTKAKLVDVTLETWTGAKYVFPDMPRETLERAVSTAGCLGDKFLLVNASHAVLTLEPRIVRTISYDGTVQWQHAAAVRELQEPR